MAKISEKKALILRSLCAEIAEMEPKRANLEALAGRYAAEQNLKLTFQGGTNLARMHGITGSATEGIAAALSSWSRAARRALLNAGV
jgi:hypothetical protein